MEGGYRTYPSTTYQIDDYHGFTFDYRLTALSLVAKGYLPFGNDAFNLYALLGLVKLYGQGDVLFNNNKLRSASKNSLGATAGLGGSYDISSYFTTALEYSHTSGKNGNENNIGIPESNLVTVNLIYNFV